MTLSSTKNKTDLVSNQETNMKAFLHVDQFLQESSSNTVLIKSSPGERDIAVLGISFFSSKPNVYIENATVKNHKVL